MRVLKTGGPRFGEPQTGVPLPKGPEPRGAQYRGSLYGWGSLEIAVPQSEGIPRQ